MHCFKCGTALETVTEERERQKCPACAWTHYDNPTPVVAAIVEYEDEIVLVRQHGWPETWWGLVTGFLERDESPEEGVLRELDEELGLKGEVASLVGVYDFKKRNELIVAYHVIALGEIVLGEELEGFKRVSKAKLRPWPFGTGKAVADWLARR